MCVMNIVVDSGLGTFQFVMGLYHYIEKDDHPSFCWDEYGYGGQPRYDFQVGFSFVQVALSIVGVAINAFMVCYKHPLKHTKTQY